MIFLDRRGTSPLPEEKLEEGVGTGDKLEEEVGTGGKLEEGVGTGGKLEEGDSAELEPDDVPF